MFPASACCGEDGTSRAAGGVVLVLVWQPSDVGSAAELCWVAGSSLLRHPPEPHQPSSSLCPSTHAHLLLSPRPRPILPPIIATHLSLLYVKRPRLPPQCFRPHTTHAHENTKGVGWLNLPSQSLFVVAMLLSGAVVHLLLILVFP